MKSLSHTLKRRRWFLLFLIFLVAVGGGAWLLPPGIDWHETFYPATRHVLHGGSPYAIPGFRYPPWAILPIVWLGLFPERLARALYLILSVMGLGYALQRLGASIKTTLAFLLSPPVFHLLLHGNIDWLALVGLVLPPPVGAFFVSTKPQIGGMVLFYWAWEAWQREKWKGIGKTFAPLALAFLGSLGIWGLWPLRFREPLNFWWNASLWPLSLPMGFLLLFKAFQHRKPAWAFAASPFLSPYVLFHSWMGALVALWEDEKAMWIATLGLWLVVLIRAFAIFGG